MKGQKINKTDLIQDYEKVKKKIGYSPSISEYKKYGKYSKAPFVDSFGSWGNFTLHMGGEIQKGGVKKRLEIPVTETINYINFIPKIYANKVVIAADLHIPYHSINIVEKLGEYNESFNADTLVLVGDVIDLKGLYTKIPQDSDTLWVKEITEETGKVFNFLFQYYDSIWWLTTNHEKRLDKLLKSNMQAHLLLKATNNSPNLTISDYEWGEINDWLRVSHPERGRKNKASLGEELCSRWLCSNLIFHTHRFAMGVHSSGKFVWGDGLHLTDPNFHEYRMKRLTTHDEWVPGWWIVNNNKLYPHVIHERILNSYEKV